MVKFGISVENATRSAIDYLTQKVNLPAGIIALDKYGNIGFYHNTKYMPVAYYKGGEVISRRHIYSTLKFSNL